MSSPAPDFDKIKDIYTTHWSELCGFIQSRFGSPPEPEDIAQEAFIKFAELASPERIENPKAYLFRSARNLVVDYHRSPKNQQATENEEDLENNEKNSDVFGPENVLMSRQEIEILESVILSLPERDRAFLLMNRLDEMTYTEIAKQAKMSRSGVQKIITQALEKCMDALKQQT
ncbi:MAG: sigma-70 family RNA polymerase sigma factor [Pseudomonadota bacterium]